MFLGEHYGKHLSLQDFTPCLSSYQFITMESKNLSNDLRKTWVFLYTVLSFSEFKQRNSTYLDLLALKLYEFTYSARVIYWRKRIMVSPKEAVVDWFEFTLATVTKSLMEAIPGPKWVLSKIATNYEKCNYYKKKLLDHAVYICSQQQQSMASL